MRALILHILVILLFAVPALADDVLILQSSRSKPYDEIINGFRSVCSSQYRLVVLSDYAEVDVSRLVREERPRLVVAVGDEALNAAKKVRQASVLAMMSLGINSSDSAKGNVTGVDLFVPPERYIDVFNVLGVKRIAVLYDPGKTGWYVRKAAVLLQRAGLKLIAREVQNPREVVARLEELKGKVDALWIIPDTTAVVKETLNGIFSFSLQQSIPVVSFTATHLQAGAAVAVDIDRVGLGRQSGEMATKLLKGAAPADVPVASPRGARVKPNPTVIENLRLPRQILELSGG